MRTSGAALGLCATIRVPRQRTAGIIRHRVGNLAKDERALEDDRLAGTRRIPTDDLAHALQAVANRVRVDEEFTRGGLE